MNINKLPDRRMLDVLSSRMATQFQLPAVYDDALSYQGLIYKLMQYIQDTIQNVSDWNDWLQEFVNTFDSNLQNVVKNTVQEWIDDGTIQVIISEALQWELDEFKLETDGKFDGVSNDINELRDYTDNEISSVEQKLLLTPDLFDGDDLEKLQQSFNYAIDNNITSIYLNRAYDITNLGSIMFPTNKNYPFEVLTFYGGKIIKNNPGFVFDCDVNNNKRNCPQFYGTKFYSDAYDCYLFNGDVCIRQNVTNCSFYKMGLVVSTSYIQTPRLINCETEQLGCNFIEAKMAYDLEVLGHRGESSTEYHFMHIMTDKSGDISFMNLRITDSLIEGYVNTAPIILGTGYGLKINGLYCESNNRSIVIDRGVGVNRCSGSIENCTFNKTLGDCDIEFINYSTTTYLRFFNITSNVPSSKSLIKGTIAVVRTDNMNLYAGGMLTDHPRTVYGKYDKYPYSQNDLGVDGISFEIPLQTKFQIYFHGQTNKQFLINAMFTIANSVLYSAHMTGILSLDGYYTDQTVQGLTFDVLSTRNTSGNINGNTSNGISFDYYFKETGTKVIPSDSDSATVVLVFPDGKYNSQESINNLTIKPLNDIVTEGYLDK